MIQTVALIVAGGTSQRFGMQTPKQYCLLGGKSILKHTVERFYHHPLIDEVRVVIHPDHRDYYDAAVDGLSLPSPIIGGKERYESVLNGLMHYEHSKAQKILIHDAARPFISKSIITQHVEALSHSKATLTAIKATDTIKHQDGQKLKTLDRNHILLAQTPQGFHYSDILKRYKKFMAGDDRKSITDDVSLYEDENDAVTIINGARYNIKITVQDDLKMGEYLCQTL
ncbi:MAG: 2-C-methyl-D-erythritol 4-phosphate cytidylyltransferase [Rickettsiales bacterium]|nr:2-C-methyl-D-erythritol 4-phosphate cytidylyltransferase [Rickettsiales bacterium]